MSSSESGAEGPTTIPGGISREEILNASDRITTSRCFRNSQRLQRFVDFAVRSAVDGSLDHLKEYALGREVYERGSDYDPRLDSIVRVEAQRLRRKLQDYYQTEGASDPVLVTFRPGSYVPSFTYREPSATPSVTQAKTRLDRRTVAVLPFLNLSPEPAQEYFCDGITEDVIHMLSRSPELNVIGRTSTFAFKGTTLDLPDIGAALGAGTLVEGSVRKAGNQVRISAEMVDAELGQVQWTAAFDVRLGDVFAIQEEIARSIATALRAKLILGQSGKLGRGAPEMDAYLLYLKGRQAWNGMTVSDYRTAISHFERAISLYPEYAAPYAGLADAYCFLALWSGMRPSDAFPKARDAAREALRLNEDLTHAYTSSAAADLFYLWDFDGATAMAKKATGMEPCYGFGQHIYGACLLAGGKAEEGLTCLRRAVELDPLSVRANRMLGWALGLQRRYEEAETYLMAAVTLEPDSIEARSLLAQLFVQQGCIPDGLAQARQCQQGNPGPVALGILGICLARSGQIDQAAHVLDHLRKLSADEYVDPYIMVQIYLALGDLDKALDFVQKLFDERSPVAVFVDLDPTFDPLRSDPKFGQLVSQLKRSV